MSTTENKELFTALAKAQGSIKKAELDCENPHFKSKYASLSSVWDACRDALSKNGLSVIQGLVKNDKGELSLESRLVHSSGEMLSFLCPMIIGKQDMQGLGSAISYARRYSLAALVGVVDESDDDGNGAVAGKHQAPPASNASRGGSQNASAAKPAASTSKTAGAQSPGATTQSKTNAAQSVGHSSEKSAPAQASKSGTTAKAESGGGGVYPNVDDEALEDALIPIDCPFKGRSLKSLSAGERGAFYKICMQAQGWVDSEMKKVDKGAQLPRAVEGVAGFLTIVDRWMDQLDKKT